MFGEVNVWGVQGKQEAVTGCATAESSVTLPHEVGMFVAVP